LLTYLIDSDRKTKDLDFSIRELSNEVDEIVTVVRSVLEIPVKDGFNWGGIKGKALNHPAMEQPGVRIVGKYLLGKMRGILRIDMAIGDVVEAIKLPMQRLEYRGKPFFNEPFSLLVYPPETVFAEKLQISINKRERNTRMKDYYDLLRLLDYDLDQGKLKRNIKDVFENRKMATVYQIQFKEVELARLQVYWEHFLKRENMSEAPKEIKEIIVKVNDFLKGLYEE